MPYAFETVDVFTHTPFTGNPLAVFPEAAGLSDERMQQIAREFNLSETVFVHPSGRSGCDARLRIFTPAAELPFAGHPTLGAAFVLARRAALPGASSAPPERLVLEEGIGPVAVDIRRRDGRPAFMRLRNDLRPRVWPALPEAAAAAAALSLGSADLFGGDFAPAAASCGVPFLFVALRGRAALGRACFDPGAWPRLAAHVPAPQVYAFAFDPERPEAPVRARMFAPELGVGEDPATGSAAAALPAYLNACRPLPPGPAAWVIEQGVEMGRPSRLHVEAEHAGGAITTVYVGGEAVGISSGVLHA